MQKVDRLGWAVGFALLTYGVRIGIRSNDPACLDRISNHLPQEWEALASPVVDRLYSVIIGGKAARANVHRFNILYGDHTRLARSLDVETVFNMLESDLRLFVAELARRRVFVHAGVVGWKGKAIVIPGRSFTGKTTIVTELVRAGATYYSDEYAVFDPKGRVHPFAKPLEIRSGNDGWRQTKFEVAHFGGKSGRKPLPVGLILVTDFRDGAKFRPRQLSSGKGVLALLSHTISARRAPERALATLQRVVADARVLKGVRGEARAIAESLLKTSE